MALAATLDELNALFDGQGYQILEQVRQTLGDRAMALSDFELFEVTRVMYCGEDRDEGRRVRVNLDYETYQRTGRIPLYVARCLLW